MRSKDIRQTAYERILILVPLPQRRRQLDVPRQYPLRNRLEYLFQLLRQLCLTQDTRCRRIAYTARERVLPPRRRQRRSTCHARSYTAHTQSDIHIPIPIRGATRLPPRSTIRQLLIRVHPRVRITGHYGAGGVIVHATLARSSKVRCDG